MSKKLPYEEVVERSLNAIVYHEEMFEESNNPMHVWAAINLVTLIKLPFPTWVVSYLEHTASNLLELSDVKGKKTPRLVSDAAGFKFPSGKGNSLVNFHTDLRDQFITAYMLLTMQKNKERHGRIQVTQAATETGKKLGLTKTPAYNAYNKSNKRWPDAIKAINDASDIKD